MDMAWIWEPVEIFFMPSLCTLLSDCIFLHAGIQFMSLLKRKFPRIFIYISIAVIIHFFSPFSVFPYLSFAAIAFVSHRSQL